MSTNPELASKFREVFGQIAKHQGWVRGGIEKMLEEQKDQNGRIREALIASANAINALAKRTESIERRFSDTTEDPPRTPI